MADETLNVPESSVKKAEFGISGIFFGLIFVAIVIFVFNYLDLISLPFLRPQQVVKTSLEKSVYNPEQTFKSLISKDKNIEDVGETITPEGKEITTPFNVSDKFQAEVKAEFSGQQALYMDQDNRGPKDSIVENEFNATLVTVGGVDSNSGVKFDRFGGMFPLKQDVKKEDGQVESKTVFPQIAMKFVDIVLVPGSSDFYLHGIDPLNNNADIYVRIVRDENGKFGQTALQCFDLNNKEGFAYHIPDEDRSKYLASKIALEKFFVPGDTVAIFTGIKLVGKGDERKVVYDLDENGKQTAMQAGIIRYKGADKINSLFK